MPIYFYSQQSGFSNKVKNGSGAQLGEIDLDLSVEFEIGLNHSIVSGPAISRWPDPRRPATGVRNGVPSSESPRVRREADEGALSWRHPWAAMC